MDSPIVVTLFSLLETRENPTVMVDKNYRIVAANMAYCASYGVPQDEVVGKTCHEVSHRSPRPCHMNGEQCPHQGVFQTKAPGEALHTHIDFQGRPDHVRILAHPIHDADGQMYMMESIHRLAPRLELSEEEVRMAGKSAAFLRFYEELSIAAKTSASVWLFGESGVGKELAARFVHEHSLRAKNPYVELNCASLPESLCESELFGHDKGAFTGGVRSKRGLFELADNGTLFLDEIGDLPLSIQGKLLRVLDSGEFRRLGSESSHRCNVRIVAATNRDLAQMVRDGSFRQDLYYRIASYKVGVPPLRNRREDIPAIAQLVLNHLTRETNQTYELTRDALTVLAAHDYPGNIRELRNVLIKAAAKCRDGVINAGDVNFDHVVGCDCPAEKPQPRVATASAGGLNYGRRSTDRTGGVPDPEIVARTFVRRNSDLRAAPAVVVSDDTLTNVEKQMISNLLSQFGNRRIVADKLGISERTLYRKIKRYGLDSAEAAT
jgi:transcriptional regulator with PAS, ATPase and Fis domain